MVIARFALNAARGKLLDSVVKRLWGAYENLENNKVEHAQEVDEYHVDGQKYFSSGSLKEVAGRYGLEDHLDEYKQSMLERVKQYVAELGKLADYLRQSALNPAQANSLSDYLMLRRSDEILSTLLGYTPGEPRRYAYLSDLINNYFERIDDLNKRLQRILYVASGFDESGSGFVRAASRFTAKKVAYKILEGKGIPATTIDSIVSSFINPFAGIRNKAQSLLADYSEIVSKWKNAYAADLADGVYAAVA